MICHITYVPSWDESPGTNGLNRLEPAAARRICDQQMPELHNASVATKRTSGMAAWVGLQTETHTYLKLPKLDHNLIYTICVLLQCPVLVKIVVDLYFLFLPLWRSSVCIPRQWRPFQICRRPTSPFARLWSVPAKLFFLTKLHPCIFWTFTNFVVVGKYFVQIGRKLI